MTGSRRAKVVVPALGIVATLMGACAEEAAPGDRDAKPSASASTAEAAANGERWLAAVEVAPLADDLDDETEQLREPFGVALVVSPVGCFQGLPPDLTKGYLIGAVGDSPSEVEELVADAGEVALFTAPVTIVCSD